MYDIARGSPQQALTDNQNTWLSKLHHTYRRQHKNCNCRDCIGGYQPLRISNEARDLFAQKVRDPGDPDRLRVSEAAKKR